MAENISKNKYGNYLVKDIDGKALSFVDEKKFKWYIRKRLAERISDSEIQLNFKADIESKPDNFDLIEKKNICVVSGIDYNLSKHHIVPRCFRKHFPKKYKNHNHHDVVLLERTIHDNYEIEADKLKKEICDRFDLTVHGISYNKNNSIEFGRYVVQNVESLYDFVVMWREHFVKTMNPKYMPENWDIYRELW